MKAILWKLAAAIYLTIAVGMMTSCSKDETNDKAGLFWLKNLTTGEGKGWHATNQPNVYEETRGALACQKGDTLVVSFTPNEKYKSHTFDKKYILDSNILVGENIYTRDLGIGTHTLSASAESRSDKSLTENYTFSFEVKEPKVSDVEAGTFLITNISAAETITGPSYTCYAGDTLKVIFRPKNEYKSLRFDVKVELFNKLNDSLFVVPDLKTSLGGGISVGKSVDFRAEYNRNGSTLSAKRAIGFFTNVEYAVLPTL